MTSTATTTQTPIQVGEARSFDAGHHQVHVYRKTETCYRVTATSPTHNMLSWVTAEFDHTLGNLPSGMTGRRAAWIYVQQRIAEFEAAAERPADLLARTAADYALLDARRLSTPQLEAIRSHRDGRIDHAKGVTVATLRALHKARLGRLVYHTEGMRRRVVGLDLVGARLRPGRHHLPHPRHPRRHRPGDELRAARHHPYVARPRRRQEGPLTMRTLSAAAVDLLFEADQYSIAGLKVTADNGRAAAELIDAKLAETGLDDEDGVTPVIRLTDLGVAELAFHVNEEG